MKLNNAWAIRDSASGTASSVARQLALSGIAVVWLLGGGLQSTGVHLGTSLLSAGLAFIVVLFLDLLQYLITAAVWGPWARRKEKEAQGWRKGCARDWNKEVVVDDREIGGAKDWFNVPTWWVFALKMAILLVGAGFLLAAFAERLTVS